MKMYIKLLRIFLVILFISCSAPQTFQTTQKPKTRVEQRYQMRTARRPTRKVPKTTEDYYELAEAQYKKISEADNEKAIQFYQRAIALKPDYALAYAGLGCAYARKYMDYEFRRDPVWKEKAQEAAQEALRLDPNNDRAQLELEKMNSYSHRDRKTKSSVSEANTEDMEKF